MRRRSVVPNAVTFTRDYQKAWRGLLQAGKRVQYQKVSAAMLEAQTDGAIRSVPPTRHGESRIPDVDKYDLGDGYRLVVQKLKSAGEAGHYVFLFVGSHERWRHGSDRTESTATLPPAAIKRSRSNLYP